MPKLPWKPWHEVVKLRDDLKSGELPLHMFAADLYEVLMQGGKRPVYERPEKFFALTFPTYNLRELVKDVVLRLAGKNDKAVRQLELTYGGGKTHTLITLRHLVDDPQHLPDLPAVKEFVEHIGQTPPKCRVAGLCFDKLDVEKGMAVASPGGKARMLKQPWSVLAYQIAGDDGLKLLHADGKAEERSTAPAENLLTDLLGLPAGEGLGTLVLLDEVLLYTRERIGSDPARLNSLENFFQYLTQAATKTDCCCVVASLLTSNPTTEDDLGRRIKAKLYDIFQRQREVVVEPVVKEDVAEVLRRRFFTIESIKDHDVFRQHVVAALKGISILDDQTAKEGVRAEERFLRSYPFHPDLTEVLYSKWTNLDRFQRTRGVLRTFALALREAERWDTSPLVGAAVFLPPPGKEGLSDALREMVAVADTEEWEGRKQAWTGILDSEFSQARAIQGESVGLKYREIEQAAVATFLHSQPIGQSAKTRDLIVLIGATRPDKIELEKGLLRWSQTSYWLDDLYAGAGDGDVPDTWRLGNRPNLTQMHSVAAKGVPDDMVRARLIDEINKLKTLSSGASVAGVRVHTLPTRPKDVEDDGSFHYAVLGPGAASESGKPSAEAKRFLDETTGPEKPRVYRNAVILLAPSKDGLELAMSRIRDYLAWEAVQEEVKKRQKDGNVDPARAQTLRMNIDRAKGRVPEAIRQAYCIVVTVSEKDEVQAFKIGVTEEPHFTIVKGDKRSRIQETAISAETLLPDGPYSLWRPGETSRRVKDLSGAFAQLPHMPKMLKAGAILDTLAKGCESGAFALRLVRPDGTFRTWWMIVPDDTALADPSLELVLSEVAELSDIDPTLLSPGKLAGLLWTGDEIAYENLTQYFSGSTVVNVDRDGYTEPIHIPKADGGVVEKAVLSAVEKGILWLRSGPASLLGEPVPAGILGPVAILATPPAAIPAPAILQENLPEAWADRVASALSIATALSVRAGRTLPWATIRAVITAALHARFIERDVVSSEWPCDFPSARLARFAVPSDKPPPFPPGPREPTPHVLVATAYLDPGQIQDLGDIVPKLLEIKAKSDTAIRFKVSIELGDEKTPPPNDVRKEIDTLLKQIKEDFQLA